MATATRKQRPGPREWDLGNGYEVGYNPAAWSYCTASSEHFPNPSWVRGEREESELPPCHCGAPQRFGFPAWVTRIVKEVAVPGLEDLGLGGFRHIDRVERRHFRLRRQQQAWVQRMREKYGKRKR